MPLVFKCVFSLTLVVTSLRVLAVEPLSQPEPVDEMMAVVSFTDPNAPMNSSRPTYEEIEILLEEAQASSPVYSADMQRLLQLSKGMQSTQYKESLKTKIQFPIATADENLLLTVAHLSPKEMERFLVRKENALKRIRLFLRALMLGTETINNALISINDSFYQKWSVLVHGRTVTITPGIFGAPGLSMGKFIRRQLNHVPFLKNLPENAGYYVATTLGLTFAGTWTEQGHFKLRIAPGIDHRVGDQFFTPFGIIGAGVAITITYEDRSESDLSFIQNQFLKTGLLTTFAGEKVLGFSIPIGINLLPIVGAAAGVSGTMSRLSLLDRTNFPRVAHYLRQFFFSRPKNCRRIFQK